LECQFDQVGSGRLEPVMAELGQYFVLFLGQILVVFQENFTTAT
jgi:hypothetical protein